jgi:outer membrane beta-barrel protein
MKNLALVLVVVFGFMGIPLLSHADSRADRYQPDAEAIKQRLYNKAKKQEVNLSLGLVANDPFYQVYNVNLGYMYHITDWVGIGLLAAASFDAPTGLTNQLQNENGTFRVKPDVRRPFYFSTVGAEVRFAPFYGKFNLFSQAIVHYDIFFTLLGGVFLTFPPPTDLPAGENQLGNTGPAGSPGFAPFGGLGLGQRYFLLRFLAFRWEFRALMMPDNFTQRNQTLLRLDLALNLGFSFLF